MHFSFLRRDLPLAISTSCFFTDAAGGYPGGVWDSSLLYVTTRPATEAPGHHTDTYGVVAARPPPMEQKTVQHRTYRNLCLRASLALADCDMPLLTAQVCGGVRQV